MSDYPASHMKHGSIERPCCGTLWGSPHRATCHVATPPRPVSQAQLADEERHARKQVRRRPVDPKDAPPGYVAVARDGCSGCIYNADRGISCRAKPDVPQCSGAFRKDGQSVIFKKKPTKRKGVR